MTTCVCVCVCVRTIPSPLDGAASSSQYTLLLSRYARTHGLVEKYSDTPRYMEQYQHTYYTSKVELKGHGIWNSTECYNSQELSREEVAKLAYQSLTAQRHVSGEAGATGLGRSSSEGATPTILNSNKSKTTSFFLPLIPSMI